ncbi:hypothetical protein K438DRAFT_1973222 [Mycena galopus ATCC 62051]|nr:hypothetical protein K438DRAFT_1973222 [Mycena galopus ATCC 62051]
MPTDWYRKIVSAPTVRRGTKSQAYLVPDEYIKGPAKGVLISIQAAFIRPKYTLVFINHNILIQFHLMQMPPDFTSHDLNPASEVFLAILWSVKHGPVYSQEPEATMRVINDWRARMIAKNDMSLIFMAMKSEQTVFNGSGMQEAMDQLLLALIHLQMPALYVCSHNAVWCRFRQTLIDYDASRMALILPGSRLPYISGDLPFHMNNSGHTNYLSHIYAYRCKIVTLNAAYLEKAHDLGLFIPNTVIQSNGHAEVPPIMSCSNPMVGRTLRTDRGQGQKDVRIGNFAAGSDWPSAGWEKMLSDVKADVNSTTLRLYSFQIFVDCVWSIQKLRDTPLPSSPRPLIKSGNSNRKRPLVEVISKTAAPKKHRISMDNVKNIDPANTVSRVLTRAQRKLLTS